MLHRHVNPASFACSEHGALQDRTIIVRSKQEASVSRYPLWTWRHQLLVVLVAIIGLCRSRIQSTAVAAGRYCCDD
jgi:hypothetical protein